jgi:hypothetical protein
MAERERERERRERERERKGGDEELDTKPELGFMIGRLCWRSHTASSGVVESARIANAAAMVADLDTPFKLYKKI